MRQHLLIRGKAGEGDLITGCHVPIQPDEGNVKLHRRHSRIFEPLVAVDARDFEAALARLSESQVVLAEAHAPALKLIGVPEKGVEKSIITIGHTLQQKHRRPAQFYVSTATLTQVECNEYNALHSIEHTTVLYISAFWNIWVFRVMYSLFSCVVKTKRKIM